VLAKPTGGPFGMYLLSRKDKLLRWTLDISTAEFFAEMIDDLRHVDLKSGSEQLVCGDYREIPVKVSRGELPDDDLMFQPPLAIND
jgi:hypothetical protein